MARGILIILLGLTTAFADETHIENLNTLLPLLNEHASAPRQNEVVNQQPLQTVLQENANQQELGGNLDLQVKPMSYKLYETSNYVSNIAGCSATDSYYSTNTVLPIFSLLLEFLDTSSDLNKAFQVSESIKNYLEGAPPSQEKITFLEKLRVVQDKMLLIKPNTGGDNKENNFMPSYQHTTIVFQVEPPGTDQQNCRETLSRLIQTAVNVYSETAKYPQCQPNGVIDENLFYPNNYAKPQKPYQFVVVYQKPLLSYYTPELDVNYPNRVQTYPNYEVKKTYVDIPNDGNIIQYLPNKFSPGQFVPNQLPKNPYMLSPENIKSRMDVLAWIRQYNTLHPESPKNENTVLEILNNFTDRPPYDNNIYSPPPVIQNNYMNPETLQNYPSQTFVYGPTNPGSQFTHIYPPGGHNIPSVISDQLQNYPGLQILQNSDSNVQLPNNGFVPGTVYVKPEQSVNDVFQINGQQNVPSTVLIGDNKLKPDNAQNKPELTLEILLSLLGRPEAAKPQLGFNPQLESQLYQHLQANNGNPVHQFSPNNPNENQNYAAYPGGVPFKQNLIDYINQLQSVSQTGVNTGNINNNYEALLKKLQRWLAVSNGNKLPQLQNNANTIELTYVLKRPKPLIYRPIYYVKYRLPYQSFVSNFQNLIMKKPGLRSNPENLYQELMSVSNITDVSPNLKGVGKEEILKFFRNGTLVDARVVAIPDNVLNEQLEATRKMNAEVDPKVLEELSGNLGFNKSKSNPYSDDGLRWPKSPTVTSEHVKDLALDSLPTSSNLPSQLVNTKPSRSVSEGSSAYPQDLGPSSVSAVPTNPLNVPPPIGYTKPLTPWISGVSKDRPMNN